MDGGFIQLRGPFNRNEDLWDRVKAKYPGAQYIEDIGITASEGDQVRLNNDFFTIGKTGILELSDTRVNKIIFSDAVDEYCTIDCIIR